MRRGWTWLAAHALVVSVLIVGAPFADAAPRPGPDWMVAWGEDLPDSVIVTATVRPTGHGPLVVGAGMGTLQGRDPDIYIGPTSIDNGDRDFAWISVYRVGGDGISVRTRVGSVSTTVDVLPARAGAYQLVARLGAPDGRYEAVTLFVANGSFAEHAVTYDGLVPSGMNVRFGTGSRALAVTDGGGAGLSAGPAGAALATRELRSPRGIVGAYDVYCVACHGEFAGPKTGGMFASAQLYANNAFIFYWSEGQNEFAGPAGRWSFSWNGGTVNDPYRALWEGSSALLASPVYAAYAPIGDAWKFFRGVRPWGATGLLGVSADTVGRICESDAMLEPDACR